MINNQPKINHIPQNYFPMPFMPNEHLQFSHQQNQFQLPIPINPGLTPPQNIQYLYFPLLLSDQFLYPNHPYFIPRMFIPPQQNQINALNQLMFSQNISNENKNININNNINGQTNILNKENIIENNNYNYNNYINDNEIIDDKERKESEKDMSNLLPKKFVIIHENNQIEKKNILYNENILEDENTLYYYGIKKDSILNLKKTKNLIKIKIY